MVVHEATVNSSAILEAHELSRSYGQLKAVDRLSFSVEKGGCLGLLGPNGAGKSTFIRMLYGALDPSGGSLSVFGLNPWTQGIELRRKIGVVTQNDSLDADLTVFENLEVFGRFLGLSKELRKKRIDELLDFLHLDAKRSASIRALSGGMKRRLVFARALLGDPELLILDEPTTGLDPAVRQALWQKIEELKAAGKTVLLTTHYIEEAEHLCTDVIILNRGTLQARGSPQALIEKHTPGFFGIGVDHGQKKKTFFGRSMAEVEEQFKSVDVEPRLVRPSNLEDVFLKVTGKELTAND